MFMTQPLLTHAFGFPLLILVGWIPVLLLDLGALGLGLNRASFNDSNPGWFQPLPPVPLDFIFSHTQLYYRMLALSTGCTPLGASTGGLWADGRGAEAQARPQPLRCV